MDKRESAFDFSIKQMPVIEVNGAKISYLEAGDKDDPIVLCLHGFPDTAHTWGYLTPSLVKAGWRVICPFLRGFAPTVAPSDGPAGPLVLGEDANALHEALCGGKPGILIGHDWGAAAAYVAASLDPDRWSIMIASSWPPLPVFMDLASYEQMKRAWYVFMFQQKVAATYVRADNFAFIDKLWKDWTSKGFDSQIFANHAKDALFSPDCLDLALNHYRSLFEDDLTGLPIPDVPMLYIHGKQDNCIGVELMDKFNIDSGLAPGSEIYIMAQVGHFPHLEQPELFNTEVLRVLT